VILVTGATGYLGSELMRQGGKDVAGTSPSRDGVDIRDRAAVAKRVARATPVVVIHTAYRQHDDEAHAINVQGSANVAAAAKGAGARLIHISSDLVFRGGLGRPLTEDDPVDPITDYGCTKRDGERAVRAEDPNALVVRTSLIYGGPGHPDGPSNHERFALEAARGEREATFFANELRSPVQVSDLAYALLRLARFDIAGTLHVAGSEAVDRYEFARLIAVAYGEDPDVLRSGESGPERPADCALDSARAQSLVGALRGARSVLGLST
jgi:dTDP-4-dehydrorhamnose reductase